LSYTLDPVGKVILATMTYACAAAVPGVTRLEIVREILLAMRSLRTEFLVLVFTVLVEAREHLAR